MSRDQAIAVVGTFDSKGEEHLFLKKCIETRGYCSLTINMGTRAPSPFPADVDLFEVLQEYPASDRGSRDRSIRVVLHTARSLIQALYKRGRICGIISAGGGTGTHLATGVMRTLPLGFPKVMISTVASRDMSGTVGTKDITMIHSVVDILGVNSILGEILDRAAGAVCGMAAARWKSNEERRRIALTMFGFITEAAQAVKTSLEGLGYEVVAFHANGTGGMAMEELAREGRFHGILDLATHELADELKGGYCRGIGEERLAPIPGNRVPRLVVPGGLDCAVLEFTRHNVPHVYKDRKIFFYDFRSAIRLDANETLFLADKMAEKLNLQPSRTGVLIPMGGWSEADREDGPLYDPAMRDLFVHRLRERLDPAVEVREEDMHINDASFGGIAAAMMDEMIRKMG